MQKVYDSQDVQIQRLAMESFGVYGFSDAQAQLEWIGVHDWQNLFSPRYPELSQQLLRTESFEVVQDVIEQASGSELQDILIREALAYYANDPAVFQRELSYLDVYR